MDTVKCYVTKVLAKRKFTVEGKKRAEYDVEYVCEGERKNITLKFPWWPKKGQVKEGLEFSLIKSDLCGKV